MVRQDQKGVFNASTYSIGRIQDLACWGGIDIFSLYIDKKIIERKVGYMEVKGEGGGGLK